MAHIVLGIGTSHSPQLSTPPEIWPMHVERDMKNPELLAPPSGEAVPFAALVERNGSSLDRELTPEKWQQRHETCQRDIDKLAEIAADANPDLLIMIGDDQHEIFHDDNMPAMCVYWGDTVVNKPRFPGAEADRLPPSIRAGAWGTGVEEITYPVASDLGKHLIETLIDCEFDVSHSRAFANGHGMGHAFGFVYHRILHDRSVPCLLILMNTYYPPNQPTPKRAYELGRVIREAVESWRSDARVGVVASGGLSHFVIDEDLDHQVLDAMKRRDAATLMNVPRERLNSGTSETRNWIAAAGAVEGLDIKWSDYVPCYRSRAGTGCAMAFAHWA